MTPPIPNLVVMGAQKSGTTSLHDTLARHPSIFMSTPLKEAGYFLPDHALKKRLERYRLTRAENREQLLEHYMLKGYDGEPIFGESPTDYSFSDRARGNRIPERIRALSPDTRFVYIVRNPFERILSAQRHNLGRHGVDLLEAIRTGNAGIYNSLIMTSLYHHQVSAYLEHFDIDRIHIMRFEDFVRDHSAPMRDLSEFLGIGPMEMAAPVRSNASKPETFEGTAGIPRPLLERVHETIVEDMRAFEAATGFDVSRWDLGFGTWCAD